MRTAIALVSCLLVMASVRVASADVITDWNTLAMDRLQVMGASNHLSNRTMAMMHLAMYEAVNAVERGGEPFFPRPLGVGPAASAVAAANAAAYHVLVGLYPEARGDYREVLEMGGRTSTARTPEQSRTAMFWPAGIPRMWNLVAQQVSAQLDYDVAQNARLFALLNLAMADAQIVGWDMKYEFGFWRPSTAIALGDADGNEATAGDPSWQPLLMNPAFPEYVSGHSTTCAAAATVLAEVVGADAMTFTLTSEANPALPPRTFDSFWAAATEAGISRVYGGIHFNFSNVQGLEAGRWLGRFVVEHALQPRR